jgi:DEAD/DEAH box helicase
MLQASRAIATLRKFRHKSLAYLCVERDSLRPVDSLQPALIFEESLALSVSAILKNRYSILRFHLFPRSQIFLSRPSGAARAARPSTAHAPWLKQQATMDPTFRLQMDLGSGSEDEGEDDSERFEEVDEGFDDACSAPFQRSGFHSQAHQADGYGDPRAALQSSSWSQVDEHEQLEDSFSHGDHDANNDHSGYNSRNSHAHQSNRAGWSPVDTFDTPEAHQPYTAPPPLSPAHDRRRGRLLPRSTFRPPARIHAQPVPQQQNPAPRSLVQHSQHEHDSHSDFEEQHHWQEPEEQQQPSAEQQQQRWSSQQHQNQQQHQQHEQLQLPPPPQQPVGPNGEELVHVADAYPPDLQRLWPFETFNAVQSAVLEVAAGSDENLVLSAPTGCGKTAVFEMCIARLLQEAAAQGTPRLGNQRVIYIAPLKALCQQTLDLWTAKFGPLGLRLAEVTGDSNSVQGSLRDIAAADIILTTPEKWDSVTRASREHAFLIGSVRLLLVDEVHMLSEDGRGATLEMIITRMKVSELLV